MRSVTLLVITGLLLSGNTVIADTTSMPGRDTTQLACRTNATRLLDEALNIMRRNYYLKGTIAWDSLRTAATERVASAGNCEEAYNVINWCLAQLDEKHSYVMSTPRAAVYNYDTTRMVRRPALKQLIGEIKGELLEGGIAYISVPWISTTDPAICTLLADSLQHVIERLDQPGISRWIVDLRKNSGGNCWPMLAGMGPLLGNGVCGYFVSDTDKVAISYKDGAAYHGRHIRCQVSNNAYHTKIEQKSIAVLTGERTSSSGELLALAFKGKEQVYLYGEPTAGLTTGNATYALSDHSMLVLTICREADRTGKVCSGKVMPDELISTAGAFSFEDPAKSAAMRWLQSL